MKGVIISSNGSGGGKTTFTMGLLKALCNMDVQVQSYKIGPDYIDPAFHSIITKKPSRNLDLFLMGIDGVKEAISKGDGGFSVIEGVMGLYDGKGITEEYSTYHLSEELGLPIILVLSPKGVSNTICAEILGMKEYRNANISGIVLNGISEMYYKLLKRIIEENCKIRVLGFVPKDKNLEMGSRHLGLIQSSEIEELEEKVELAGKLVGDNVDVQSILNLSEEIDLKSELFKEKAVENLHLRIGVAKDKAFSFYYEDNLDMLREAGEVVFFSPMKEEKIPENLDFLYLGGGYPEVFKEELSSNETMRKSINEALENGLPTYAECGGLMYLTEGFQEDGKMYPFVSFFKGTCRMTNRLQNFGYADLTVGEESPLHRKKIKITCHEFHRSLVELEEEKTFSLEKTTAFMEKKNWECGYVKKNTLAGYPHIHFSGNREFLWEMLKRAHEIKIEKQGGK